MGGRQSKQPCTDCMSIEEGGKRNSHVLNEEQEEEGERGRDNKLIVTICHIDFICSRLSSFLTVFSCMSARIDVKAETKRFDMLGAIYV